MSRGRRSRRDRPRSTGGSKAYLTFDIDCLDPLCAPGTGTPVPGGLTSHQAASIIRKLDRRAISSAWISSRCRRPMTTPRSRRSPPPLIVLDYLCLKAWQKGARGETLPD